MHLPNSSNPDDMLRFRVSNGPNEPEIHQKKQQENVQLPGQKGMVQ